MMRTALLLSAVCAIAHAQLADDIVDVAQAPSFETHNMTFSLMMNCYGTSCFMTTSSSLTTGVFNKTRFVDALVSSYNTVSQKVQSTDSFVLTYSNVVVDRMLIRTSPFTVDTVQANLSSEASMTDPNYWNVFIRITLIDVPVDVSASFHEVVAGMATSYAADATFHMDSVWISADAYFITEQLAYPVIGRGHKDQTLLVPLILGVFCMLTVPILLSACAVSVAKRSNKADAELEKKERLIKEVNNNLVTKQSAITVFHETEETREIELEKKAEQKRARDETELTRKDVDWHAGVSAPFGAEHDE